MTLIKYKEEVCTLHPSPQSSATDYRVQVNAEEEEEKTTYTYIQHKLTYIMLIGIVSAKLSVRIVKLTAYE